MVIVTKYLHLFLTFCFTQKYFKKYFSLWVEKGMGKCTKPTAWAKVL